jgi:hypothetical protein
LHADALVKILLHGLASILSSGLVDGDVKVEGDPGDQDGKILPLL